MNKQAALTEAISLTNEILSVLDEQDFLRIAELKTRREPLIQQAFATSVEQLDHIKAVYLQNLNEQVVKKLGDLKQSVLQQQKQIRNASKATRAYADNQ